MKHYTIITATLLLCLLISPVSPARAQTNPPVVRAVLFYSPTCGHCEYVISEFLVPMIENHGEQLQIIAIDVTQPSGQELFLSALRTFGLDHSGVPFLVIDNTYLMGSGDIPEKFPGLFESSLAQGGTGWPDIPGLMEMLQTSQSEPEATATPAIVVRAVLFYRSACSHCQKLTEEVIPPLMERYGDQLEIFGVDASTPEGDALYDSAIERFKIDKFGVPTLILGEHVLVGGAEIEEKFEGIINEYLIRGGLDWPDIPGLGTAINKASEINALTATAAAQSGIVQTSPASEPSPASSIEPSNSLSINHGSSSWLDTFSRDPYGNTLSVLVLLGMLWSIGWAVALFRKTTTLSVPSVRTWAIPILCIVGLVIAGYLAYVETTQVDAICGPVGDCNTVQQSEYARLFGILPIGVLGMIGYIAISLAWLLTRYAAGYLSNFGYLSILAITTSGTLFSAYLTFLEPFVIGATCAWCLTSSILMTTLMLLSAAPAKLAVEKIQASNKLYKLQGKK